MEFLPLTDEGKVQQEEDKKFNFKLVQFKKTMIAIMNNVRNFEDSLSGFKMHRIG